MRSRDRAYTPKLVYHTRTTYTDTYLLCALRMAYSGAIHARKRRSKVSRIAVLLLE